MGAELRGEPRWFGAPILAVDEKASFSRSLAKGVLPHYFRMPSEPVLVFTIGTLEAMLAFMPLRRQKVVSLHQWKPIDLLPFWKRAIYRKVLEKSSVICTYSRLDEQDLSRRFPGKKIRWIGNFTDTDFFDPEIPSTAVLEDEKYILCVGDHLRREDLVKKVADALKIRVTRLSSDPSVEEYHKGDPSCYVKCLSRISFEEVRSLYKHAKVVINPVRDELWPVGITTFCEALSMNCAVITSPMHSCSGYEFDDGYQPFIKVAKADSVTDWVNSVEQVLNESPVWRLGQSPRDLALALCSYSATSKGWKDTIDNAKATP